MVDSPRFQRILASAAFLVAAALAFTSLAISEEHTIAAGVGMVIAQFLLLCASILGIDYKITQLYKQQPK